MKNYNHYNYETYVLLLKGPEGLEIHAANKINS